MGRLANQTIASVRWSVLSQVVRLFTRTGTMIVLTRLIAPREFGLMSMAAVFTGFLDLFTELGTTSALIQKDTLTPRLLSTTFWANIAFGFLAGGATFATAPLVAAFYGQPRLVPVLELLSVGFAITSLSLVQRALRSRELAFRNISIAEAVAAIAGSAAAIALAAAGYGVYSLVGLVIVMSAVTTLLLWLMSDWRPTAEFALGDLRSISGFSANLMAYNIVNYLGRNVDYLLIGRFLGAQQLGYYTLAYNLLLFPVQYVTLTVGRVTFPVYASIQDDNRRLANAYLRVAGTLAALSFPLMLGLLAVCDVFVRTVYGARWAPAIPVVAILAPVGLIQSISAMNGSVYKAKGRADLMLRVGGGFSAVAVASFFLGLRFGMVGVAAAYAVTAIVLFGYPLFSIPLRLIGLRFADLLRAIRYPLAASVTMIAGLGLLRLAVPQLASAGAAGLLVLVAAGSALYFGAIVVLNRSQLREMWLLIRPAAT